MEKMTTRQRMEMSLSRLQREVEEKQEAIEVWESILPFRLRSIIYEGDCSYWQEASVNGSIRHYFRITVYDATDVTVEEFRRAGVAIEEKLEFNSFSGSFRRRGVFQSGSTEVKYSFVGLDNPQCQIERYNELTTRFRARCTETKEVVYE